MDELYLDALRRLLSDHCTPHTVREVEGGSSGAALWAAIEASGLADLLVPEADGGAGVQLEHAFAAVELCGACLMPLPLAETMVVRALLARAGVDRPTGSIALARGRRETDGRLVGERVVGGRVSDRVLVAVGGELLLLSTAEATRTPAIFPLDATFRWSAGAVSAACPVVATEADTLPVLQAGLLAAQLSGALSAVFARTLAYANDRVQFGRPIGKFQAIQHQLSVMAEHVFAARMAAQVGCGADRLRVAIAKARTAEAAVEVAALSHSIHGAIGFTEAFDLQLYTRRLHAWRQAGGTESTWHDVIGSALVDAHPGQALDLLRATTDTA